MWIGCSASAEPFNLPDDTLSFEARKASLDFPMNQHERIPRPAAEAEVKYLDGDFRVVRPGAFVRCAVTGAAIRLDELRYWSAERQEAYASAEVALERVVELGLLPKT